MLSGSLANHHRPSRPRRRGFVLGFAIAGNADKRTGRVRHSVHNARDIRLSEPSLELAGRFTVAMGDPDRNDDRAALDLGGPACDRWRFPKPGAGSARPPAIDRAFGGPSRLSRILRDFDFRVDGAKVVTNWADLIDGTILHPIEVDVQGGHPGLGSVLTVWTGTKIDGTAKLTGNCQDWSSVASSDGGVMGFFSPYNPSLDRLSWPRKMFR